MNFVADLHIHSRFSMATSKAITVPHLAAWARNKGIDVLGCGDFTHPKWRGELRENLLFDEESGFYRLKGEPDQLQFMAGRQVSLGGHCGSGPFFCLQTEISSIYKRAGKTRKVHNLVFMPSLEAAEALSRRLSLIGNINSDGRPILGLDSHDLLEMVMECSDQAVLVPAHIWTPWFSIFGSKSGFDHIEDCYGDLTSHIFALETGLSSDPAMNRHLSALDQYALISNSDAHSGPNLGREANLFSGEPSYAGMFAALRNAAKKGMGEQPACRFAGTLEFYPEEGKYHLDGHRACGMVVDPSAARDAPEICPVCGKPLTIGVLRRVMELADRREPGEVLNEVETRMLIPLPELVGEIMGAAPGSKKVMERYAGILAGLGSELDVLCRMPLPGISGYWEPLGEAVSRMRQGKVHIQPGFDGQYGIIRVFNEEEVKELRSGFKQSRTLPGLAAKGTKSQFAVRDKELRIDLVRKKQTQALVRPEYSREQLEAINSGGPALILAGPGSGKTRVLVARILRLMKEGIAPERILALTFTRRAAGEMRERLEKELAGGSLPECNTLHGLAWGLMREKEGPDGLMLLNDALARQLFVKANTHLEARAAKELWNSLTLSREKNQTLDPAAREALHAYEQVKNSGGSRCLDYADLQDWLLRHGEDYSGRWEHVLVDEAQDLSPAQLEILRKILPACGTGFFGIGDPDQAIYEFRGAAGQSEAEFRAIWPDLRVCQLGKSYRASQKVLDLARNALCHKGHCGALKAAHNLEADLRIFTARDEHSEAEWIAGKIMSLLGAGAHTLLDGSRPDSTLSGTLSPGDIAVLVRLKAQLKPVAAALEKAGIPFAAPGEMEFWEDELCAAFLEQAREREPKVSPMEFLSSLASTDADSAARPEVELLKNSQAFAALCQLWRDCGDWDKFFEQMAWLHEAEMLSLKAQRVRLLTLHASKGLEFQLVFIPGLENGLLPLRRELLYGRRDGEDAASLLEAERRLLYVGLTRAARGIFLSYCQRRRLYGKALELGPSPFLDGLRSFCRQSRLARHSQRAEHALSLLGNDGISE